MSTRENSLKMELCHFKKEMEKKNISWAIFAGAAAYCYGNKRKLADIDVLVDGKNAGKARNIAKKIGSKKIDIVAELEIQTCQGTFPFRMDEEMTRRIELRPLLGVLVPVVSVEDNIVFKSIAQRGENQGKHDAVDIIGMIQCEKIDMDYLKERIEICHACHRTEAFLRKLMPDFK